MTSQDDILNNISSHYSIQVMRAFGNIDPASKALEVVCKSLNEIYRYFEPDFFKGHFYVCKSLNDSPCFDEASGIRLYDKSILLNKTDGQLIIQVFDDESKLILWENKNPELLINQRNLLTYYFNDSKEYFFANNNKIDITYYNRGSRFAIHYHELVDAFQQFAIKKIYNSSCPHFSESWADDNRLFFKGGGSGSNVPEKFMQLSLYEFLNTILVRGISWESSREYNVIGDMTKPKPVDIKMHWREANRMALIEIKFIGTVKKDSDGEIYSHGNSRANSGLTQLKEYFDAAHADSPATIIKAYLVVIDGRRNNLTVNMTTIRYADGMHFKDVEIIIDEDKKFHESVPGFEKPIKMFATPICS